MVIFFGVGEYGKRYINYCISEGLDGLHLTDSDRSLWWKQYNGMTIFDPNCVMWDMYDMVVITSDNKQYCEDAINQLSTVYMVPREKIKTCQEVILLTKELRESYKWKSGKFANTDKSEIIAKNELSSMLDIAARGGAMNRVAFYGFGESGGYYVFHCISEGMDRHCVHLTDPDSDLWWKQYSGITIFDPNCMMWDMYDMVVITSDNKQHCEDAINQLSTVYMVPREKIKTCWELVILTKRMKEFYKWKSGKTDNIESNVIVSREELGSMLDVDSLNDLEKFFLLEEHRIITKWTHYFEAYDKFFSKYRGKDITMLEIGVFKGGSLQMWKNYFKTSTNKVQIYGIDIDPECKSLEEDGIDIFIGSQEDREFLRKIKKEIGKVDILIDDGGHTMNQQIVTFEELFDLVADDGLYLCEDLHTSYWAEYGGGYKGDSFIEYSKNLIDYINAQHSKTDELQRNAYTDSIGYVTYCDSMMFIEKKPNAGRYAVTC